MTIILWLEMDALQRAQLRRGGTVSDKTLFFATRSARPSVETLLLQALRLVILDLRMALQVAVAQLPARFN